MEILLRIFLYLVENTEQKKLCIFDTFRTERLIIIILAIFPVLRPVNILLLRKKETAIK